jgi:hypothetical protein
LRQIFPHADLLGTLTRKKKSNRLRHQARMNCKPRGSKKFSVVGRQFAVKEDRKKVIGFLRTTKCFFARRPRDFFRESNSTSLPTDNWHRLPGNFAKNPTPPLSPPTTDH